MNCLTPLLDGSGHLPLGISVPFLIKDYHGPQLRRATGLYNPKPVLYFPVLLRFKTKIFKDEMINIGFTWCYPYCCLDKRNFSRKMTLLAWELSHLYLQAWVLSHQYFSALHILWDWTKYNHNQPSWLSGPSITFKILAYCDTGVYNTCFKISSDLASSKKNHHLGFQQREPIGVLPCYLKSLTARIAEPRRKDLPFLENSKTKRRN